MSLNATLSIVLEELQSGKAQNFKGNPVADFIRNVAPAEISALIADPLYSVEGSPGKGNWAEVPWIAIMDLRITTSAQNGYYVVYLFKTDYSGVVLSLNQGVTKVREFYRSKAQDALTMRSRDYLSRLGKIERKLLEGPISLQPKSLQNLARDYEFGSIVAKEYDAGLASDATLLDDLHYFVKLYKQLADSQHLINEEAAVEEDETDLQLLRPIREHKRYERNEKLAREAKKIHGYKCKACKFDFAQYYGEIGKGFIEAHHLVPLSELGGERIRLDPKKDFTVLCSNCHRMIHKTDCVHDVEKFAELHVPRHQGSLKF